MAPRCRRRRGPRACASRFSQTLSLPHDRRLARASGNALERCSAFQTSFGLKTHRPRAGGSFGNLKARLLFEWPQEVFDDRNQRGSTLTFANAQCLARDRFEHQSIFSSTYSARSGKLRSRFFSALPALPQILTPSSRLDGPDPVYMIGPPPAQH